MTADEETLLRAKYHLYADAGKLDDLARQMGRTKPTICTFARRMGMTQKNRPKRYFAKWKYLSEDDAQVIWDMFKASGLGMLAFCKKKGFDDLGFARTMKQYFGDEWEHVIETKAPKQTLYRFGRQFEYRVRDELKALGYLVTRSPASKSPVDLFAIGKNCVLLIQCKRSGQLGVKEWNELLALAESVNVKAILAVVRAGGRGSDFFELTGYKDGTKKRQPMLPVKITAEGIIDDLGEAVI
jgi:Holliday junction resolvase